MSDKERIRCRILWRDNLTGAEGCYFDAPTWDGHLIGPSCWPDEDDRGVVYGMSDFWWTEGNFSCDVNRGSAFIGVSCDELEVQSGGEHRCAWPGHPAGRFEILHIEPFDTKGVLGL